MWEIYGNTESISYAPWPTFDESKLVSDTVEIVVQLMGKVKAKLDVKKDLTPKELEEIVLANDEVKELIAGKQVMKVIVVPGRLVNIVAK